MVDDSIMRTLAYRSFEIAQNINRLKSPKLSFYSRPWQRHKWDKFPPVTALDFGLPVAPCLRSVATNLITDGFAIACIFCTKLETIAFEI